MSPQRDPATLHLQLAASAFTLRDDQAAADFRSALGRRADVVGFTEVHERADVLGDECRRAGYDLMRAKDGDVALAVKRVHQVSDAGQVKSIPAAGGPASQGGHSARPVLWVTFTPLGTREEVSVEIAHWPTKAADTGGQQVKLTDDMAEVVASHSRRSDLGFWMGDVNNPDRPRDVTGVDRAMAKGDLTSCWDELGRWPDTHGHSTLDVVGSYDPDRRVHCLRARRWPSGHSDHRAVSAWYLILHAIPRR